jgi:hypothetical protein
VARLESPDEHGYDHRVVLAFDTDLAERSASSAYLAPAPEDAQRGAEFALAADAERLAWFAGQQWLRDWARASFVDMIVREERARSRAAPVVDDAVLADRMEGPREDVARLMALIELLDALEVFPGIRFVDRFTKPTPTPIEVDLVLDVGNSRTCGLLIETHPDQLSADVTQAVKLQLRDLGCRRQIGGARGALGEVGVEGQDDAMVVAVLVRRLQPRHIGPGPVDRALLVAAALLAPEERHRDPDPVQHLDDLAPVDIVGDPAGRVLARAADDQRHR